MKGQSPVVTNIYTSGLGGASIITTSSSGSNTIVTQQTLLQTIIQQRKLELLEKIRQLRVYVDHAEKDAKTKTEKVISRGLRAKRRDLKQQLAELITADEEVKYNQDYDA